MGQSQDTRMVRMKSKVHKEARKDVLSVKTKQAARCGIKRDLGDDHAEEVARKTKKVSPQLQLNQL
ncbi:hypothetical protein E2562_022797 [Oryza meyeriana var. granulata]|uniref:Uncharacterized protein n=1 Tax=Oryza meyeriana var. granulata TaxID=110450 RepID=A0A6G1EYE0_9ORYZ|nr:hypothetical protein E2562_022797 [Oryza meyeriana var. granulata]